MPRVFRWAKAHATLAGVVLIVLSVLCAGTLAEALTRLVLTVRGHYPQKDPILHHSLKPHAQMKRVESEFQVVYRASIMASATPLCFWTTRKHTTVERSRRSTTLANILHGRKWPTR